MNLILVTIVAKARQSYRLKGTEGLLNIVGMSSCCLLTPVKSLGFPKGAHKLYLTARSESVGIPCFPYVPFEFQDSLLTFWTLDDEVVEIVAPVR